MSVFPFLDWKLCQGRAGLMLLALEPSAGSMGSVIRCIFEKPVSSLSYVFPLQRVIPALMMLSEALIIASITSSLFLLAICRKYPAPPPRHS